MPRRKLIRYVEKKRLFDASGVRNQRLSSEIEQERHHIILRLKTLENEVATALSGNIGGRVSHHVGQLLESFQQQLAGGQRGPDGSPKKEEPDGSTLSTAEP